MERNEPEFFLANLLADSPDFIFITNEAGDILFFNSAFDKIWNDDSKKPRHLTDVVSGSITTDTRLTGQPAIEFLLSANHLNQNWDVDLRDAKGTIIPVLMSISRLADDASQRLVFISKDIRHHKKREIFLSSEQQLYQTVFNNISESVFLAPIDENGIHQNFIVVNETASKKLGYSPEEFHRMNARSLNPSANIEKVKAMGRKILREKLTMLESIHVAKDGTQIPVSVIARVVTFGNRDYVLSVARDLREVKALQRTEERFARLLEHSWDEIFIFHSENFEFMHANQGALNNLGYTLEELKNKKAFELLAMQDEKSFRELSKPLLAGEKTVLIFEAMLRRKNNTQYPVEIRLQISQSEVPPIFLANVQDITQRKLSEQKLNFLANYDALTGLPNRALFFDRLTVAIEQCKRADTLAALIFLDVDNFKTINDTQGHDAGDELIKTVGQRLLSCVRRSDTVARLGGDEFTLVITNVKQLSVVELVAQKLLNRASQPATIGGQNVAVTVSIGVCIFPFSDTDDPYTLLKQADTAMYQAKSKGKNNIQFYTEMTAREELRRIKYDQALKTALEHNQLFTVIQPRVSLATGDVVGGEVLLRWRHPELGIVSPLDFIPLLEASGKIKDVGLWVIEQTCRFLAEGDLSAKGQKLSVNVTSKQLDDAKFFQQVKNILDHHQIAPGNLELEITESVLLDRNDTVVNSLQQFDESGINICLDDFGTGYSSLSYLKQFPINVLKIDRSFVKDLTTNNDNKSIVEAIIGLAKNLRLHLVAEGIETKEQSDMLFAMGCFEGQGFYYYKPIFPHEYLRLLDL